MFFGIRISSWPSRAVTLLIGCALMTIHHSAVNVDCLADIAVFSNSTHKQIDGGFVGVVARVGPPIPLEGFTGMIKYANPPEACDVIEGPPQSVRNPTNKWIALIARGTCQFETKIRNAQKANYHFAIIHNNVSEITPMHIANLTGINIAAVAVSLYVGMKFNKSYQYHNNVYVVIDDDANYPFDLNADLLIPFAVVVAICSVTMIAFMICKCVRDRRRAMRHRLPTSSLKKIPVEKYVKGSPYEMCAICLDDYVDGEKLRVLPCAHAYHTKCIDPWLTRNRRVCPICKRKVFAADETPMDDSDTDTDHSDNDERTPLVRQDPITQQPLSSQPYVLSRERILAHLRMARALHRAHNGTQGSSDSRSSSSGSSVGGGSVLGRPGSSQHFYPQPAHIVRSVNSLDEDCSVIDVSPTGSLYSYSSVMVRAPSSDSQLPHPGDGISSDNQSQDLHINVDEQPTHRDHFPV